MSKAITKIEEIGNYYGTLEVISDNGKFYWGIEDWNDYSCDYGEIPESLYNEIIKHNLNTVSKELNNG